MVKKTVSGSANRGSGPIRGLHTGQSHLHGVGKAGAHVADKGGFDGPINAPWRKTVSIFKQPVTLVRTTSKETKPGNANELQAAANRGRQEKPKQVFWAKRLEGLRSTMPGRVVEEDDTGSVGESMGLPSRIQAVGPEVDSATAAASLASALNLPNGGGVAGTHYPPITGQTNPKKHLEINPGVFTNPDQPLIHAVVVSERDVTEQEQRVILARKRLEEAMKHFG